MKVLGTGLDGLVGSRIVEFPKNRASWRFELALKNDKISNIRDQIEFLIFKI